jgi:hypothetical protein
VPKQEPELQKKAIQRFLPTDQSPAEQKTAKLMPNFLVEWMAFSIEKHVGNNK